MDEEVELAPFLFDDLEDSVDGGGIRHIAMSDDFGADFLGEWAHAFAQRLALERERQLRAGLGGLLGDAPCDGAIVGDAEHEPSLASQQAGPLAGCSVLRFGERSRVGHPVSG